MKYIYAQKSRINNYFKGIFAKDKTLFNICNICRNTKSHCAFITINSADSPCLLRRQHITRTSGYFPIWRRTCDQVLIEAFSYRSLPRQDDGPKSTNAPPPAARQKVKASTKPPSMSHVSVACWWGWWWWLFPVTSALFIWCRLI